MIELRSDTFTKPREGMRRAMYEAELGDDVYQEDPTVNALQEKAAELCGTEAALFVSSGTMGNLLPLAYWGGPTREVLLHERSHILEHELGGIAVVANSLPIPLGGPRGILKKEALAQKVHSNQYDIAHTALICIENTHNFAGGTCWSREDLADLSTFAQAKGLAVHMDGARSFNASVATGLTLREIVGYCDSANLCLSKGLGAPVGSLIVGGRELIEDCRRWRKLLGGGMRQAGVLAAAGLYALENNIERLEEDHRHARILAEVLGDCPWARVDPEDVETNIVFVQTPDHQAKKLEQELLIRGLALFATAERELRIVTSMEFCGKDLEKATKIFQDLKP